MKKNIDKQFTLEYLFVNQMNIMRLSLSEHWKAFTKGKYSFVIVCKTRNVRILFNLKDGTSHVSSVVCEEKCNCGENYIAETGRNVTIR